ncbi:amidase [Bernardetia sp. OM2101]|uniref:amidase n=1 Tax=Bernardetia sp. OM2101 TaxID=3344876 RepID=UPI0035CF4FE2
MKTQTITELSVIDILKGIKKNDFKISEVVEAHISKIEEVNPALNAMAVPLYEQAREKAKELDNKSNNKEKDKKQPLLGLPVTIKDHVQVKGGVSTFGLKGLAGNINQTNSTIVQRLEDAGAIVLGCSNMAEFGGAYETDNLIYGRTNNPYDINRTSGGSSGGESALIAAQGSPLGIGTDAGGSIRVPAHYTGIVGIKPTRGRVPLTGILPETNGMISFLAYTSPMARYVDDVEFVYHQLIGSDGQDPRSITYPLESSKKIDIKKLKVAYYTGFEGIVEIDSDTSTTINNVVDSLKKDTQSVEEINPIFLEKAFSTWFTLFAGGGGSMPTKFALEQFFNTTEYGIVLQKLFAEMDKPENIVSLTDFQMFLMQWDIITKQLLGVFQTADVIISPVTISAAPLHGTTYDSISDFVYTQLHNLSGLPTLVVRCGTSKDGLPIGVQITANMFREDICFAVGKHLEEIFGGYKAPQI